MIPPQIRRPLLATLEFSAYFVVMVLLGVAMFALVRYHPRADAKWYILITLVVGLGSAGYAAREYMQLRRALRRTRAAGVEEAALAHAEAVANHRLWSERLAEDEAVPPTDALKESRKAPPLIEVLSILGPGEAAPEGAEGEEVSEPGQDMSLDAIRARIAERMAREDHEREEAAKNSKF
ncbi:hypothetical protein ACG3SL_11525 [Sphingomonas sp. CJ20]